MEVNNETTSFEYDADGQRLLSTYPDGTKVYSPFPGFEEEILPVGGTAKRKTRQTYTLGGQLIGTRVKAFDAVDTSGNPLPAEPDTDMYYLYTDAQGSVIAITKKDNTEVSGPIRYEPYGDYRFTEPAENPLISNLGYTGHVQENELDLIYMNARYQLPEIGVFASPDSIVPDPMNPQSFNRYSYVGNNPLGFTDATGHCPQPSGLHANDNIVCVAGFIPTATTTAIPWFVFFQGDNRDFSSNSPITDSRFWAWIDADTGQIVRRRVHPTQRASGPNGELIGEPSPPRDDPWHKLFDWFYGSNSFSTTKNEDESITFNYNVVCSDPICNSILAPDGAITFKPNEFGSFDTSGRVNKFPNLEAYHWRNGELQNDYLFQIQNFSAQDRQKGHAQFWTSIGMATYVDFNNVFINQNYAIE